jgi:hypothetical protein
MSSYTCRIKERCLFGEFARIEEEGHTHVPEVYRALVVPSEVGGKT